MTAIIRQDSVNDGLTVNGAADPGRTRRREPVENGAYIAFCARAIRAPGRRLSSGDVEALPDLLRLHDDLDEILTYAVQGLARLRLLVDTDRSPRRHQPSGRTTTMEKPLSSSVAAHFVAQSDVGTFRLGVT